MTTHAISYNTYDDMPLIKIVSNDYRKLSDLRMTRKLTAIELSNLMNTEIEIPIFFSNLKPFQKIPMVINITDDLKEIHLYLPDPLIERFNERGMIDGKEMERWLLSLQTLVTNTNRILAEPMVNSKVILKSMKWDRMKKAFE